MFSGYYPRIVENYEEYKQRLINNGKYHKT